MLKVSMFLILCNLCQIIRMDNHLFDNHCQNSVVHELFDHILTDPPYGIRAGARKSGRQDEFMQDVNHKRTVIINKEHKADYIPCTQQYAVEEVLLDLMHVAAISLKL